MSTTITLAPYKESKFVKKLAVKKNILSNELITIFIANKFCFFLFFEHVIRLPILVFKRKL